MRRFFSYLFFLLALVSLWFCRWQKTAASLKKENLIGEEIKIEKYDPDLLGGIVPLKVKGTRVYHHDSLYFEGEYSKKAVELKAIPYYAWGNRGLSQMRVWMHEI